MPPIPRRHSATTPAHSRNSNSSEKPARQNRRPRLHRDHPYVRQFRQPWEWFTYFFNSLAARTFLRLDLAALQAVDDARRTWVARWLEAHCLPNVSTGSYYVKSFRVDEPDVSGLEPLVRDGLLRLCFKPPQA